MLAARLFHPHTTLSPSLPASSPRPPQEPRATTSAPQEGRGEVGRFALVLYAQEISPESLTLAEEVSPALGSRGPAFEFLSGSKWLINVPGWPSRFLIGFFIWKRRWLN